ncbi:MAG TPA: acyl-CoA dehydrogenase [Candidatus Saccharimonadales bacterium]|jgi:alkylation response protein AidB-like acyl-CoA dehydrogenase|nr:acyl-CoA dehydrogenase [Candidatus Saccharimonadales bacterium]
MDLNLTKEELAFRDELRTWLTANVPKDWDEHRDEPMDKRFEYLKRWQRKLFEGGWAGISWPKEYGGLGASLMQQVIFWQEMALAGAPPLANVLGLGLIGPTLIAFGTPAQKERFLRKILSAEEIWCQGFSEPDAGSDLANVRCEAKLEGGHYVVNGQKVWNSYGWASQWCELVVRTDPNVPKHKGLTVLLVDMKSAGVDVRPLRQMTGETEFNEIFFHDVKVPVENVVGKVNQGWEVAMGTLMHERGTFGAGLQIAYKRNIDRLIALARTRQRNGKPAAQDAVLRQKIAQCYAEIEIMRMNQMRAFSRISATGVPGPEGSIQKIFWSELNQRFQQVAQELLGPYGQLEGHSLNSVDGGMWSYGYLRTRGNTIEAGTSEIQRNIIGHFVLGLPKSY